MPLSLSLSLSLIGLFLSSIVTSSILVNPTYAEGSTSIVEDISITVESSCLISSGGGTYINEVNNGTTTEVPANTITSICNDASGYALFATGYSGDTYSGGSNNKLLASSGSNYDIVTNTSGNDSYWAMKVAKGASSSTDTNLTIENNFSDYHTIPNTFTKVASYNSMTSTTGASIAPTYKISINSAQPAGIYEGKVKYVLVHPDNMTAGTYSIAYNANGGTGTMDSETGLYNFEDHTLQPNAFTAPSGYLFSGWCTVQDQTQSPQTTCSGTTYVNQDTIPNSTVNNGSTLNLYATWTANTMQNVANWGKSVLEDQTVTAIDSRDGQEYTVARLKDGKLWMTKNLNIAGGTLLTSDKTDFDDSYSLPTTQGWQSGGKLPASSTSGFNQNNYAFVYNSGSTACGNNSPCYSYYSWDTATLGSGRSISAENTDASHSICPKGWRLPTSGSSNNGDWKRGDFYRLITAYGVNLENKYASDTTTFYDDAGPNTTANFVLPGNYYGSTLYNAGMAGDYWSSTSADSSHSRYLGFSVNNVGSASNEVRRSGFAIRCLARD